MKNKWINLFLLLTGVVVALFFYNKYRVAPDIKLEQLNVVDAEGKAVKLEEWKGKKLVISFYASWCGNCLDEMEVIHKIKNTELSDVEIICITDESLEKLNSFKNKKGYPFTFLKLNVPFSEIGIHSIPVTYIVNRNFQIAKEQVGYIHWDNPATVNHIKGLF